MKFFDHHLSFIYRKGRKECSAPMELPQRTPRYCIDIFVHCWQLLSYLPVGCWEILQVFQMMREGHICHKSPRLSIYQRPFHGQHLLSATSVSMDSAIKLTLLTSGAEIYYILNNDNYNLRRSLFTLNLQKNFLVHCFSFSSRLA